jgi:predicted ester cyclase
MTTSWQSTQEQNKAIVRRYFEEMVRKGNLNAVEDLIAPNFVRHHNGVSEQVDRFGPEEIIRAVKFMHSAFDDYKEKIELMIAEGDTVACRVRLSGIHRGEFYGIAPTFKRVEWVGDMFVRIANGKIVEMWTLADSYGLQRQLGVIPTPTPGQSR